MIAPFASADAAIDATRSRTGSRAELRRRDEAIAWLLEQPGGFAAVRRRVEANPVDALMIELLGRFVRLEAEPLLRGAFADARTRRAAAPGLGRLDSETTRELLRDAARGPDPAKSCDALAGLAAGGSEAACPTLLEALDSVNVEVRWTALSLGLELGCVDAARREAIAATDPDPKVRELARR
jgi:HEAT repeat protein